jgi:hypothetical protein
MKRTLTRITQPREVNFFGNPEDFKVALMGELGFSTQAICDHTGLTPCQVTYRLGKAQVKRANYRNGKSALAETIINNGDKLAKKHTINHIKQIEDSPPKK